MRGIGLAIVFAICAIMIGMTASMAGATAESAPPHLSQSEVNTVVERARQFGPVESVEAVSGSDDQAQIALDPEVTSTAAPPAPVDLVVLHGNFTDTMSKAPPGKPAPSGTVVAYIIDRSTGEVGLAYVGNRSPALGRLGVVERMTPSNGSATASRVGHRTFRKGAGHHPRARAATWGNNCKPKPSEDHCYSVARWAMTGGEEVLGSESEQKTTEMYVPGAEKGDFVDNEEWVAFPGTGYWVEAGQQGGEYKGCCNLWWFYAYKNATGYHPHVDAPEVWEVTFNTWNEYGFKGQGNGTWCFYTAPDWTSQNACVSGFSIYSKELEDGMEVATEEKPENYGSVLVNQETTNGGWYAWNFAKYQATTPGLCWEHYTPSPYPGDINYGTCET
jgi:hypothetical protein